MKTTISPKEVIEKVLNPETTNIEVICWWAFSNLNKDFMWEVHPHIKDLVINSIKEIPDFNNNAELHETNVRIKETYEHTMETKP